MLSTFLYRILCKSEKVTVHIVFVSAAISYMLIGAAIFQTIENSAEKKTMGQKQEETVTKLRQLNIRTEQFVREHQSGEKSAKFKSDLKELLENFENGISNFGISAENVMDNNFNLTNGNDSVHGAEYEMPYAWTYSAAVLFTFTIMTTIGYGNVSPSTVGGRIFCIFYAAIGIPLGMIVIADIGKFISELAPKVYKKLEILASTVYGSNVDNLKKEKTEANISSIGLFLLFVGILICGALVIPLWEDLRFLEALYFMFVTLTTIGFGDIIPEKSNYLFFTLLYIALGLSITTLMIEAAGDSLKKLHYKGQQLKNVSETVVWFGGQKCTAETLAKAVGRAYHVNEEDLEKLDLTEAVKHACAGTKPPKEPTPVPTPREPTPASLSLTPTSPSLTPTPTPPRTPTPDPESSADELKEEDDLIQRRLSDSGWLGWY